MATQTTTMMVDDIDGSTEDVVTCAFGLGDSQFEIDLNTAHREELEQLLEKFVEAARPVSAPKPATGRRKKQVTQPDYDASAVRHWARSNGLTVSDRGRVSQEILEAYRAAQ